MKESVLDVLIYLFENFMTSEKIDFEPESQEISIRLEDAGFETNDVVKAMQWVLELKENVMAVASNDYNSSIRIFSVDEQFKISPAIRHTLYCMERDEVITPAIRELIIDRVMALDLEEVQVDQLKWIMLFVLCFQGQMPVQVRRLEDVILLDSQNGTLH
jgi:Smg protein